MSSMCQEGCEGQTKLLHFCAKKYRWCTLLFQSKSNYHEYRLFFRNKELCTDVCKCLILEEGHHMQRNYIKNNLPTPNLTFNWHDSATVRVLYQEEISARIFKSCSARACMLHCCVWYPVICVWLCDIQSYQQYWMLIAVLYAEELMLL